MFLPSTLLIAGILLVGSAGFYAIRFLKPNASREYDIVLAVTGIIYSLCILYQGERLIPLLFFAQMLLVGMVAALAVETFRLRMQLAEKARELQGKPSGGDGGRFNRTYRPRDGQGYDPNRTVTTSSRERIRKPGSYTRTIEERATPPRRTPAQPAQLPSSNTVRPRRSIRPEYEEEVDTTYTEDDYTDEAPPRRPRPRADEDPGNTPRNDSRRGDSSRSEPSRSDHSRGSTARPDPRRNPSRDEEIYDTPEDRPARNSARRTPPPLPDDEVLDEPPMPRRRQVVVEVEDDEDGLSDA